MVFGHKSAAPPGWKPAVPGDLVMPLAYLEENYLLQMTNLGIVLVYEDVLDPDKLRSALEDLVQLPGWQRLGARLRTNSSGKIEWHIPSEFSAKRPPITFAHANHGTPLSQHPQASLLPRPPTDGRPAIVADPEQWESLAWGDRPVKGIKDYLDNDQPITGLRVHSFTDATLVILTWQHILFDSVGIRPVLSAWENVLWGREDQVPVPCFQESDPFAFLENVRAAETHLLADRKLGIWGLMKWGLAFAVGMFVKGTEHRMMCIPESFWRAELDKALAELRAEAEDPSKVFLTENDIITAWVARCTVISERLRPDQPVSIPIAMTMRKVYEGTVLPPRSENRPYIGNAFGYGTVLVPAGVIATKPISWLAQEMRRAINGQGTREQFEAYYQLRREHGHGMPIVIMGDGDMVQLGFTNWTKGGLFQADFGAARVGGGETRSCKPVYAQSSSAPTHPPDTFVVVGKDGGGNYWVQTPRVKGKWAKFEETVRRGVDEKWL